MSKHEILEAHTDSKHKTPLCYKGPPTCGSNGDRERGQGKGSDSIGRLFCIPATHWSNELILRIPRGPLDWGECGAASFHKDQGRENYSRVSVILYVSQL